MSKSYSFRRRDFGSLAAISSLAMLSGCGESPGSGPSVDDELSALGEVISSLSSTVDRFKTEEWKDVVPDIQSDALGVATAFANLRTAMGKR